MIHYNFTLDRYMATVTNAKLLSNASTVVGLNNTLIELRVSRLNKTIPPFAGQDA